MLKRIKSKKLRILIRICLILFIIIPVLIIALISPITKYLVEKYDVEYTGREVKMDWAYVNPLTGYVYFNDLQICEENSDSIFFSASGVSANFTIRKLFSKEYEITQLTLDEPKGVFIRKDSIMNLDDVIHKFAPKVDSLKKREPVHFSIRNVKINNGAVRYRETMTPVDLCIKGLYIESSGIYWNSDTIALKYSFLSGMGKGDLKGEFTINTKNLDYRASSVVHTLDLSFIEQYLAELTYFRNFRAMLDADVKATGNLRDEQQLDQKGKMVFSAFHFGKDSMDDYASFDRLEINTQRLSPNNHIYFFDSVILAHPFFKYEEYDHLNNLEVMFGENGNLVTKVNSDPKRFNLVLEIGKYIQKVSKNFLASDYHIKRLAITNGDMQYNNFALNQKFSMAASPLFVTADSIDKDRKRVEVSFRSAVQPYGNAFVFLSINPKDSSDFDLEYHFQKFPAAMFNPYLISYTSFPMDRGTIELNGKWNVRNGIIQSTNHLVIVDPRLAERVRKKDMKWIPMPLVMAFIRERGNVIDYEIPITGNLKDPKFKWKDAIFDLLRNIFVKPPTTPYRLEVKNVETKVERSLNIKWEPGSVELWESQEKFIRKMADFLEENPTASINIQPFEYSAKEKESILFFEAKKKYFRATHPESRSDFTEDDSLDVDKMWIKEPAFVKYLDAYCKDSMLFTIQQKCMRFIGAELVAMRYAELCKTREKEFRKAFVENGTNKRVSFNAPDNSIPYNGYSYFKINYKGEIPAELREAYEHMERLNEDPPRKRYLKFRRRNKVDLVQKDRA